MISILRACGACLFNDVSQDSKISFEEGMIMILNQDVFIALLVLHKDGKINQDIKNSDIKFFNESCVNWEKKQDEKEKEKEKKNKTFKSLFK
jgi:hypothetical protein